MSADESTFGSWTRRRFVQAAAVSAVSANLSKHASAETASAEGSMIGVPFSKRDPRIAVIGTGGRGTSLLANLLAADAQVVAVCDIVKSKAENADSMVVATGREKPRLYTDGPHDFENMLGTATSIWCWWQHPGPGTPNRRSLDETWQDVAIEVPGVTSIEDCWQIVRTSEETRRHCMMLENCCYGYNETLILRMTHAGLFGDLLYGEGAYLHDLRAILFSDNGEGLWRRAEHTQRNGNLYPSHGLGPVANYMGIQRGDRFDYLVSMSSLERSLDVYRKEHLRREIHGLQSAM